MAQERSLEVMSGSRSAPSTRGTHFGFRAVAGANSWSVRDETGFRIATINNAIIAQKDVATLLAAAPELLAALMASVETLENLHAYIRKHEAVLPPTSLSSLEIRIEKFRAAILKADPTP